MPRGRALLLFPPGWGMNIGGPHLGLPLLAGFLEQSGHRVEARDLNIEFFRSTGISLALDQIVDACVGRDINELNQVYDHAREPIARLGAAFNGTWEVAGGFRPTGFDPASSNAVRQFSDNQAPYTEFFENDVIPRALDWAPDLIGISIVVPDQVLSTFEFCRRLRSAGYQGQVILGGSLVTRNIEEMALPWVFDLVDGLCCFQGEEPVDLLLQGRPLEDIPNLTWRGTSGIVMNETRLLARDHFREPSFTHVNLDDYWGATYLPLVASRGCYYGKCTFCAIPYSWGASGFLGHGTPDTVVETIERSLNETGNHRFKFADESLSPVQLEAIADRLLARGLDVEYEGYGRFDRFLIDATLLTKLARSGLRKLYLGMEIVESKTRASLNKSDSAPMGDSLERLHDAGIKSHLFCMFGFPGTGIQEALDTVEFLFDHRELIDSVDIGGFTYAKHTVVPGVKPVIDPAKDWALDYAFEPEGEGVLTVEEVALLADSLENLVWSREPRWLHPLYRMCSPWRVPSRQLVS